MDDPEARNKYRETLLALFLIVLLGGSSAFFLYFLSLGMLGHVFAVVAWISLVGFLHYALWGYSMSREVAGEREEAELKERLEAEPWERPETEHPLQRTYDTHIRKLPKS